MITPLSATFVALGHTVLYVGILYLRHETRPSPERSNFHPSVIKARFIAVTIACVLSIVANRYILQGARLEGQRTSIALWDDVLGGWGEWNIDIRKTVEALLLTVLLFLGPVVEKLFILQGWRTLETDIIDSATSIMGWRNYIIVPPSLHHPNFRARLPKKSSSAAASSPST
jgi:hypothetical protein